jgi:hypothetical protein
MVDALLFTSMALSFEGTEAAPHFDRTAFRIAGRRIFATLHGETASANLFLSKTTPDVYCAFDNAFVYPVPNKFGLLGWTTFELNHLPPELVSDALLTAYNGVLQTGPAKG